MRIGVAGYKGKLGSYLVDKECVPLDCDITDENSVKSAIEKVKPQVIINCAAYTDARKADEEQNKVIAINVRGITNLRRCYDGKIIHLSTLYVFKNQNRRITEKTTPHPQSGFYNFSKWGGEIALRSFGKNDLIVRTLGLYGYNQESFFSRALDTLRKNEVLYCRNLGKFPFTYIPHLGNALLILARMSKLSGYVHYTDNDYQSPYMAAKLFTEIIKFGKVEIDNNIIDDRFPIRLPVDLRYAKKLGLTVYTLEEGLREYVQELRDIIDI